MNASMIAGPHAQTLSMVAPGRLEISVLPEAVRAIAEVPAKQSAVAHVAPRTTIARPTPGATGLFQGWGPRLG